MRILGGYRCFIAVRRDNARFWEGGPLLIWMIPMNNGYSSLDMRDNILFK